MGDLFRLGRSVERHAMAGTLMHYFSASQISTFKECQRKWAWKTIAKIEAPPNASAALGSETHGQLEHYLRDGKALDFTSPAGYFAAELVPLLPAPKTPGMKVEHEFSFQSGRFGLVYRGYIDVLLENSSAMPGFEGDSDPLVSDHKTTGNMRWAKTPEDLRTDPQGVLYAVEAMSRFKASSVNLVWQYTQTKGAKRAKRVHLKVHAEDVAKQFSEIELVAREMHLLLDSKQKPLDLPASPAACEAYGGCPYRHLCNLSPAESVAALINSNTKSLLNRLHGRTEAPPPADVTFNEALPPVAAVNPPEYQPPPTEAPTVPDVLKAKRGRPRKDAAIDVAAEMNAQPTEAIGVATPRGFILYVDCIPVGQPVFSASKIVEEAKQTVAAALGVADYRQKGFGEGTGALCAEVAKILESQAGKLADIVTDSVTPEGILTLNEFAVRAALVVRRA